MKHWLVKNTIALIVLAVVIAGTLYVTGRFRAPGRLTVLEAQAMDMSAMRPPAGAPLVELADVRAGSIADAVTYTGEIAAYNEQDITPRITGTIVSLPVYPGDAVTAGELVAQLDTSEVDARADQAAASAMSAHDAADVAHLTHHVHHRDALEQADDQVQAAQSGLDEAKSDEQAAGATVVDARSALDGAKANARYWDAEIVREKSLADAGAVSIADYQSELAQSQAATAVLSQDEAKLQEALAAESSANAKVKEAASQLGASQSADRMATADIAIAATQADEASADAIGADAAAKQARIQAGYARIVSPADGVVIARPTAPGTLVQPGDTILRIAEIDRVRVQANVAVADLAGMHPGSPVRIVSQGAQGEKPIPAVVSSIFPSANPDTHTAIVEAIVSNPDRSLLPGGFATMTITRAVHGDSLIVPAGSVISEDGQNSVWIARGAAQMYQAVICHSIYTAEEAKRDHYICPMDHGALVPMRTPDSDRGLKAYEVEVRTGASDGVSTEVASSDIAPGDRVVVHGMAGLVEGASVVNVGWGPNGPESFPSAAAANSGRVVYRCDKCGMTFSAADAKRDHYIDPMDGGKLVAVVPAHAGGA